MIELGNYNTLTILRRSGIGLFLGDEDVDDLLLPEKYVREGDKPGDRITVFCYLDHEDRPVATTLKPLIKRNEFAFLQVADVTEFGAFMDWGLEKHLLVPFREQRVKMVKGRGYVVYCYLDEKSFRLVASSRLDKFLSNDTLSVKAQEEVQLLVSRKTDLGWEVIVNGRHKGLVFANEVFKKITIGDGISGYVRNIRPDNKLDIALEPIGHHSLEPAARKIYDLLEQEKGFLDLHDKSSPEEIRERLQMSKKAFKKGIGTLYRERKITIREDGIHKV